MANQKEHTPITDEGRETYCISLAYDLVEQRLREGTATSQETTHFLKLASSKERLEKKRIEQEIELSKAKIDNLNTMKNMESLYAEALAAFRTYRSSDEDANI